MSDGRSTRSGSDRAQTLPDFVIGITVFLLTIGFIVAFVPQMTVPYQDQETAVVAERTASDLSGTLLSDPETSSGLNEPCTIAFFTGSDEPGCSFDTNESVEDQLGISSKYSVNVTLEGSVGGGPGSDTLCGDEDGDSIGSCEGDRTERLAVGPSPPHGGGSVATARQVVHVDGTDAVLEVSIWR